MPQATPKRSGRKPKPGSRFPGQIVADNVRIWRGLRGLSQAQLAERMSRLGHGWSESIVGFVEQNRRNVTVDELIGLGIALGVRQLTGLLDPLGPEGEHRFGPPGIRGPEGVGLDWGGDKPLRGDVASDWVRGGRVSWSVNFDGEDLFVVHGYTTAIQDEPPTRAGRYFEPPFPPSEEPQP